MLKKPTEWSKDYDKLHSGFIFELEGVSGRFRVVSTHHTPGGGQGMGEYPQTWRIQLRVLNGDSFYFIYDPWCNHIYRRMRIVEAIKTPGEPKESWTMHFTEEYMVEQEASRKRREEAAIPAIIKRLNRFKTEMSNIGTHKPSFYLNMTQMGQLNDAIKSWEESGLIQRMDDAVTADLDKIDGIVGRYNDIILVYNPVKGYTDNG